MTVIAWDGKTLAADKRLDNGSLICTTKKIRRIGNLLCGACGDGASMEEMFAWIERGRKPEEYPTKMRDKEDGSAIILIEDGVIKKYGLSPYPTIYEDRQHAIGSGRDFAIMAMYLGKTAKEAVELASVFDQNCGNGVDVLEP
jgi:20S proteasome alpha/beta subunit